MDRKDLGIIIDSQLKFHGQTEKIVAKATQLVGLIRQSFKPLDKPTFTKLYKGLVRPTIEYGNIIWGPNYKIDSAELEEVQRRSTKLLTGLEDLNYENRLCQLQLPSLKYRCQRRDQIQNLQGKGQPGET